MTNNQASKIIAARQEAVAIAARLKDEELKTAQGAEYLRLWTERIREKFKMSSLQLEDDANIDKAAVLESIWKKEENTKWRWRFASASHAVSVSGGNGNFEISFR